MIEKGLCEIGLSEKEASVYAVLLRYGTRQTSFLAKKAKLNRGTAYVTLHALLQKGIVTKATRSKIQYFSPRDPKDLLNFLDHQSKELDERKSKLSGLLEQLYLIRSENATAPRIEFFEGLEGARSALEDTLNAKEKILRGFLSIMDIQEFIGYSYFDDYTSRRIKSGYFLQAIRTRSKDVEAIRRNVLSRRYKSSAKQKRKVRYVSEALAFPISMYIYDDKITLISSKDENFSLIIQSKELSNMQRHLFELIWNSAELDLGPVKK